MLALQANGAEDIEFMAPVDILRRAGTMMYRVSTGISGLIDRVGAFGVSLFTVHSVFRVLRQA